MIRLEIGKLDPKDKTDSQRLEEVEKRFNTLVNYLNDVTLPSFTTGDIMINNSSQSLEDKLREIEARL